MAAAFTLAGFDAVDVHMQDLLEGDVFLKDFDGMAVCGGFSYGDVLGAGGGWSKTILYNNNVKNQFKEFFNKQKTIKLGVCNGCQMLSNLKDIDWKYDIIGEGPSRQKLENLKLFKDLAFVTEENFKFFSAFFFKIGL